jgi:putative endonuclease
MTLRTTLVILNRQPTEKELKIQSPQKSVILSEAQWSEGTHARCRKKHPNTHKTNMKTYYVYILTNKNKTVLYTGVTNDLQRRIWEHKNLKDHKSSFSQRYNCFYLVYYEEFNNIDQAIEREKIIKGWKRFKKENIINEFNPEWKFLNNLVSS